MSAKPYTVTIGGLDHTLVLDDEDAARYGATAKPVTAKKAPEPANKARTAVPNKSK